MKWWRDLLAHLSKRADVTDERARRQWGKVREADRVIREYDQLDVYLKLDVRRK